MTGLNAIDYEMVQELRRQIEDLRERVAVLESGKKSPGQLQREGLARPTPVGTLYDAAAHSRAYPGF